MNSYMNEIALLRRLEGNDRIIKLIDSEASRKKGSLIMVRFRSLSQVRVRGLMGRTGAGVWRDRYGEAPGGTKRAEVTVPVGRDVLATGTALSTSVRLVKY